MFNRLKDILKNYACLTAGRYYNQLQLERIRDLILRAEFVEDHEKGAFLECVDSPLAKGETVVACKNAHLISLMSDTNATLTEYLSDRAQTVLDVSELWRDKLEWLKFAAGRHNSYAEYLESAVAAYAFGDLSNAKEKFEVLAHHNNVQAVKYLYVVDVDLDDEYGAAYCLRLLDRLRNELYHEETPLLEKLAFDAFPEDVKERAYNEASSAEIDFFYPEFVGSLNFFKGGK